MAFVWVLYCFCFSCKIVNMQIRGFHLTVTIYASPSGPVCLKYLMLTLSGPVELLFLLCSRLVVYTFLGNCCANCVDPLPLAMGARFTVFRQADHVDRCMAGTATHKSSPMSRLIQVRQPYARKSGFTTSSTEKYTVGSRYR